MDIIKAWKILIDESTYPAEYPFPGEWISFGKGYPIKGLGGWQTPLISHELSHFDIQRARHQIVLYLKSCLRDKDGMMAARVVCRSDVLYRDNEKGRFYEYSHPPVWSYAARKILEKQWDTKFALFCFESGITNLKWWIKNRQDRIGLFWYLDSFPDRKDSAESGCQHSPRWDFTDLGPFPCIDLNCQILLYLENMIFLAEKLGMNKEKDHLVSIHGNLKKIVMRYFWDDILGFFCDYELTGMNAKKTSASFWTLISGLAMEEDVERMVPLLLDPGEFGAPCGLPSVALSEPKFKLDFWRGCLWPSEVFWTCIGLQRYHYNDIARKISKICLDNVYNTYNTTGKFWEFYNPIDGDITKISRNGIRGPYQDCPASVPLISLEKIATGEIIC
ncbi:MAG TPA: trehalase family glycosidase [Candidatus Ratteibacteria bacterium]|mgnify:FL=1|nr:trehalase family glycosidase [bacterium]HRS05828.1 trehalase family glycosidase [Candidatus Ratteibacteria bacterium]HRV04210.1 trehalase family glycosidase [Candidatus Ratteibacteria bacterium]